MMLIVKAEISNDEYWRFTNNPSFLSDPRIFEDTLYTLRCNSMLERYDIYVTVVICRLTTGWKCVRKKSTDDLVIGKGVRHSFIPTQSVQGCALLRGIDRTERRGFAVAGDPSVSNGKKIIKKKKTPVLYVAYIALYIHGRTMLC